MTVSYGELRESLALKSPKERNISVLTDASMLLGVVWLDSRLLRLLLYPGISPGFKAFGFMTFLMVYPEEVLLLLVSEPNSSVGYRYIR